MTSPGYAEPYTAASQPVERDRPGWLSRFVSRDPVRAVAVLLIVAQLAWRTEITARGFIQQDGFVLASRAAASPLSLDFLLGMIHNHLMPAGWLLVWLVTDQFGLAYWPYVVLLAIGQLAVSIAFYRLLRLLLRPGWALLIPLGLFLFSPLELAGTTSFFGGLNALPMQLAMILAIGAQVKYARTRDARHLVSLAAALILGLLFFEKSLLIAPLMFLLTACLFVTGGPVRSTWRALSRFWPSWLVLTVISAAYLALYFSRAQSSVRQPTSIGGPLTFVRDLVGVTLVPGLMGGPLKWIDVGDGPPLVGPDDVIRWLAWAVFLALVVITVALRPAVTRAWVLLGLYLSLVVALYTATRLDSPLAGIAGLNPRYVVDVVVVAVLCVAVATIGMREPEGAHSRTGTWTATFSPQGSTAAVVAMTVVIAAVAVGSAVSSAGFARDWSMKMGRDYLRTAEAELATAPPGTVFFDWPVPNEVVAGFLWPDNLQSHFFRPARYQPEFVTETERLSVLTSTGHIRRGKVGGISTLPGPDKDCGYKASSGLPVRMPLTRDVFEWRWAVRIGYLASGPSPARIHIGKGIYDFQISRGLHDFFFVIQAGGDAVELTVDDPTVTVCVDVATVGNPVPVP